MVRDPLRDAARAAVGAGRLDGADVRRGRAAHPVCGDELEVDLRVADGRIAALAWRARGCPATMAVAGCLSRAMVGVAVDGVAAELERTVAALGGLSRHEGHALGLATRAVTAALAAPCDIGGSS